MRESGEAGVGCCRWVGSALARLVGQESKEEDCRCGRGVSKTAAWGVKVQRGSRERGASAGRELARGRPAATRPPWACPV